MKRHFLIAGLAALTSACASTDKSTGEVRRDALQWSGNGYLSPGPTSEPEFIGYFETESECEDAISVWKSVQVVGNPIFAECLPVDRR